MNPLLRNWAPGAVRTALTPCPLSHRERGDSGGATTQGGAPRSAPGLPWAFILRPYRG
jgi:hypothetical protein